MDASHEDAMQRLRDTRTPTEMTADAYQAELTSVRADLTALLAALDAATERVRAMETALDRDGYSYCEKHGVQKWRGNLQLPKGYRGCGSCYWDQWYERKMAQQPPAASPATTGAPTS